MKILITGTNGYIGKSLYNKLKNKYEVTPISRKEVDLTNYLEVKNFFKDKKFDVLIHCAVVGGKRTDSDTSDVLDKNLKMYYNLLDFKNHFNKMIHFGSGAENLDNFYGLSKKIILKSLLNIEHFYNIRIFAVFDENELDTRFIKTNIKQYINKKPIIIYQDKFMDFFYMEDLVSLIDLYIQNNNLPKTIDCSYNTLYKLSDIANLINNLDNHKVDILFENEKIASNYCGSPNELLSFIGLEKGIQEVYRRIKNEY